MYADQTATVGLARHAVLQALSNPNGTNYTVFTHCGATLSPKHWDGDVAVVPGTVDCAECVRKGAKTPKVEDLAAVDAIMAAYMACNAAPGPLEYEVSPKWESNLMPATAMGYLSTAGRTAWRQLGLPERLWDEMVSCGENAAYVFNLLATGLI